MLPVMVSLVSAMPLHEFDSIPPPSPSSALMPTRPCTVFSLMVDDVMLVVPVEGRQWA